MPGGHGAVSKDDDRMDSTRSGWGIGAGHPSKGEANMGSMKRLVKGALLAAGTALAISAAPAMSAAAATSRTETLSGTIVFAAVPGTNSRTVISSVVLARGVFRGVGRVVERVPPDPAGVSQDDLVFRSGTMHVVSTPGTLLSFSINPHSCLFTGTQQFTWDVTGGTGQFDDATGSFTGYGKGRGAFGPQPRRQLLAHAIPAPRGGQVRGERDAVVLKRVSPPEDLRSARVIRLGAAGRAGVSHSFLTD